GNRFGKFHSGTRVGGKVGQGFGIPGGQQLGVGRRHLGLITTQLQVHTVGKGIDAEHGEHGEATLLIVLVAQHLKIGEALKLVIDVVMSEVKTNFGKTLPSAELLDLEQWVTPEWKYLSFGGKSGANQVRPGRLIERQAKGRAVEKQAEHAVAIGGLRASIG